MIGSVVLVSYICIKKHTHLFGIPVESFIHLADEMAKVLDNCYHIQ